MRCSKVRYKTRLHEVVFPIFLMHCNILYTNLVGSNVTMHKKPRVISKFVMFSSVRIEQKFQQTLPSPECNWKYMNRTFIFVFEHESSLYQYNLLWRREPTLLLLSLRKLRQSSYSHDVNVSCVATMLYESGKTVFILL